MARGRISKGRKKVEIKSIKIEAARQVTFSKRRFGLFKKASDLMTNCDAKIAIVVFSPAGGKAFSFGLPTADFVIDRFLASTGGHPAGVPHGAGGGADSPDDALKKALEGTLGEKLYFWDANTDDMGIEELEEYQSVLLELKKKVVKRAEQLRVVASARDAFAAGCGCAELSEL